MTDAEGGNSLQRVLSAFGIEWSAVILLSTLALGFFGLDQYVNLTYWLLGSLIALVLVYTLRDTVSSRFAPTLFIASAAAAALIGGAFVAFRVFANQTPPQVLQSGNWWSKWVTLYIGLTVFGPLGWTILSYRKHERIPAVNRLPRPFERAVDKNLSAYAVYRLNQQMLLHPSLHGDELKIRWINSYTLFNPTASAATYTASVTSHNCKMELQKATVNEIDQPNDDPRNRIGLGWKFDIEVPPGKPGVKASFEVVNTYRSKDSDTFATFNIPSTRLELQLFNKDCPSIAFEVTDLSAPSVRKSGERFDSYTIDWALPFQGFLLAWHPKRDGEGSVIDR